MPYLTAEWKKQGTEKEMLKINHIAGRKNPVPLLKNQKSR
jgi:hypothetical protein